MKKGKERHLFPGNNTSVGFFSYYSYILPQDDANHIFCLKGGPGVGKSTFMKTIGKRLNEKGYDIEYLHCSSDPFSLDGIVVPEIKVAMVDGTAPHIVDPINPGAVDEIINLGEYWNLDDIKHNKQDVISVNNEVGNLFKRAYKYLTAAKSLIDDATETIQRETQKSGIIIEADKLAGILFNDKEITEFGKIRKCFAAAISPDGIIHYLETLYDDEYDVYLIENNGGVGVSSLLKRIADEAIIKGYNVELYYCPMNPSDKVEHLIIPEIKKAVFSKNEFYDIHINHKELVDLTQYTDSCKIEQSKDDIDFDNNTAKILINKAVETLKKAKTKHDEMETYYVPNMDFEKEKEKLEEIYNRILKWTQLH